MTGLTPERVAELRRLHAEAVANKGGNFEVDTDEAFRIAMMENAPALLAAADENDWLRAERDALKDRLSSQFKAAFAKLREVLGSDLGSGVGLIEILDGIEVLRAERDELLAAINAIRVKAWIPGLDECPHEDHSECPWSETHEIVVICDAVVARIRAKEVTDG